MCRTLFCADRVIHSSGLVRSTVQPLIEINEAIGCKFKGGRFSFNWMKEQGMGFREIGKALGIRRTSVYRVLGRFDTELRPIYHHGRKCRLTG